MLFSYLFTMATAATSAFAAPHHKFKGAHWKKGTEEAGAIAASGAAASSNKLIYGGGNLLSNVIVKPLYWSNSVMFNFDAFYTAAVSGTTTSPTPFMKMLTQYSVSGYKLGAGSLSKGIVNFSGLTNGSVTVSAVENYIISLVNSGTLNPSGANLYVPVHFAPGVVVSEDKGLGLGDSCTVWCAFHYSVYTPKGWVYYGIIPDMGPAAPCNWLCGSSPTVFGLTSQVASHELAEAITDPSWNQNGWLAPGAEIGDLCSDHAPFCGSDGYQYHVQTEWSNAVGACAPPPNQPATCRKGMGVGNWTSNCAHSVCKAGAGLTNGCSQCASAVCNVKPACCTNSWSSSCVGVVNQYCGAGTC
ncbi:UNVERIFIED_CONTAM: hypothetical protein HDU68_012908 [Siphonaria sp. JEL0065]|nr:hypothetical protein HDU68_012908 [Siphonaria sp. JEL0065]